MSKIPWFPALVAGFSLFGCHQKPPPPPSYKAADIYARFRKASEEERRMEVRLPGGMLFARNFEEGDKDDCNTTLVLATGWGGVGSELGFGRMVHFSEPRWDSSLLHQLQEHACSRTGLAVLASEEVDFLRLMPFFQRLDAAGYLPVRLYALGETLRHQTELRPMTLERERREKGALKTTRVITEDSLAALFRARPGSGSHGPKMPRRRAITRIEKVLRENQLRFQPIYGRHLKAHPGLKGRVVLKLIILPSGQVSDRSTVEESDMDANFSAEVLAECRTWEFGKINSDGDDVVNVPFTFHH